MSYPRERTQEEKRRRASESGVKGLLWAQSRKAKPEAKVPEPVPVQPVTIAKPTPTFSRCKCYVPPVYRCGLPKGHDGDHVRTTLVTEEQIAAVLAELERKAEEAKAKEGGSGKLSPAAVGALLAASALVGSVPKVPQDGGSWR